MRVAQAGIDTWSPCWYLAEGSPAERAMRSLANVRVKRGWVIEESIGGHKIGWFPGSRLLYAEGHPGGDRLGCPEDLPEVLERLVGDVEDYGIKLPAGRTLDQWRVPERRPGFGGVRRCDATCDLAFDSGAEGIAVLAGVAALSVPRAQLAVRFQPGGRAVETVELKGHGGRKTLGRWYDKSVEAGTGARGTLIRPEDQRRYVAATRRCVQEMTSSYVQGGFQRRFLPLWQATKGITVAGPMVLAKELAERAEAGEITWAAAERAAGYLLLQQAGGDERMSVSTRQRRRREVRGLGLVLADGALQEVEVNLHDVLDQVMESDAWGRQG